MAELRVLETQPQKAHKSVMVMLTDLIAMAEVGDIESVAVACVLTDGAPYAAYSELNSRPAMIGSVALLQEFLIEGTR